MATSKDETGTIWSRGTLFSQLHLFIEMGEADTCAPTTTMAAPRGLELGAGPRARCGATSLLPVSRFRHAESTNC